MIFFGCDVFIYIVDFDVTACVYMELLICYYYYYCYGFQKGLVAQHQFVYGEIIKYFRLIFFYWLNRFEFA